jgi:hypothetical protein
VLQPVMAKMGDQKKKKKLNVLLKYKPISNEDLNETFFTWQFFIWSFKVLLKTSNNVIF